MNEKDVIYFEVDNWIPGQDYPACEPFLSWMKNDLNLTLEDPDFVKENKLCVCATIIDMSVDFLVTAPRKWVEENCPCLLNSEYSKFVSDGDETRYGFGYFLPYTEEYIGKIIPDDSYFSDYDESSDEEDENDTSEE